MSSLNAVLQPSQDGSIHLPLPPELRGADRLRVVAWLEAVEDGVPSVGAGKWAISARGIARPHSGETTDELRMAYLRAKFETP